MTILENHFYHKTISLLTGVFGSVFNEIKISRTGGKLILVPIAYSVKRKSEVRNDQNPDPNAVRYKMQLPRMGFKLTGLRRDSDRSLSKYAPLIKSGVDRSTVTQLPVQYNRVPYVFSYNLSVKTKTIDDMLQIIEQILVSFNPTLRVTVIDNPDLAQDSSVTIKLLESSIDDITEGTFDGEEVLESSLNFELEGYLYLPTISSKIIRKVTVNTFNFDGTELLATDVET